MTRERLNRANGDGGSTGRYDFDGAATCSCGHTRDEHAALMPRPCFAGCDCDRFTKKRLPIHERVRRHPAVRDLWSESGHRDNGRPCWWVRLEAGWSFDGMHGLHEDTLGELERRLRDVRPCDCEGCRR